MTKLSRFCNAQRDASNKIPNKFNQLTLYYKLARREHHVFASVDAQATKYPTQRTAPMNTTTQARNTEELFAEIQVAFEFERNEYILSHTPVEINQMLFAGFITVDEHARYVASCRALGAL